MPVDDRQPWSEGGRRERLAWLLLLVAAAWARLWDLGVRAMTHDESLHAFYSFRLLSEGTYQHDPVYHGPLLYHLNALVFFLVGATDFTARLAPTLAGLALVACPWLLRGYVGRRAAWLAAAFMAVSPTLLFYSRHLRNDIYIAFFTMLWVYGAIRYLADRRSRWLYLVTLGMGLSFITKEVSFITGAVIGSFFVLLAAWPGREGDTRRRAPATDLAILMLALVLPFASGAAYLAFGWIPVGDPAQAATFGRGALVVLALVGLAAVLGARRFGWRFWLPTLGAFWGLQITFFTTFFTNVRGGVTSGIVGSLGYWLTQQEVARAGQPWFYYGLIGLLYEFLPVVLGGAAAAVALRRMRDQSWDPVDAADLPASTDNPGPEARRLWLVFVIWWTVASWVGYGLAGEKMPWLFVHQVLPLCLLAGWGTHRLVGPRWEAAERRTRALVVVTAALTAVTIVAIVRTEPFSGRDLQATADTAGWWIRVLLLSGLAGVLSTAPQRVGWRAGCRMAGLGLAALGAVLTVRASLQVNFVNYDMATEPLSYAQASPDVKQAMREIETIDMRSGAHHGVRVAVDDENSWPFSWYLRDYPNTVTWGSDPSVASAAEVILVGPKNRAALAPYVARGYTRQRGILYWWPLQGYASLTPSTFWALLAHPDQRRFLWQVVMHREYGIEPGQWPGRREFDMYVRDDAAALVGWRGAPGAAAGAGSPLVLGNLEWTPDTTIAGPFEGQPLSLPTSVAVSGDGAWLVADGGNHRVVVLERDGRVRLVIGAGRCALEEPGQPGCVDPDGAGPLATGDGQFNEPWGVASGPAGEIFVADTWNGRVQVFDAGGRFLRAWGRFGQAGAGAGDGGQDSLYGPRALVFSADDELVVADTGNKRLLFYTASGQRRRTLGPLVDLPPPLDEPTGIGRDANGTLLVADMWNQRVIRIDRYARPLAAWPVPSWESRDANDKPAVAVDANGRIYACDPEGGRILVFAPSGTLEASLRLPDAGGAAARPTGVAIDDGAGKVLVIDRAGQRLLVMPPYLPVP